MYDDLIDPLDETEDCGDPDMVRTALYDGDSYDDSPTPCPACAGSDADCPYCEGTGEDTPF